MSNKIEFMSIAHDLYDLSGSRLVGPALMVNSKDTLIINHQQITILSQHKKIYIKDDPEKEAKGLQGWEGCFAIATFSYSGLIELGYFDPEEDIFDDLIDDDVKALIKIDRVFVGGIQCHIHNDIDVSDLYKANGKVRKNLARPDTRGEFVPLPFRSFEVLDYFEFPEDKPLGKREMEQLATALDLNEKVLKKEKKTPAKEANKETVN